MSNRVLALIIGIARTAGGLVGYFWPGAFARHGQVPGAADNADSRYVTRLFGARDMVIGVATVAGPAKRTALWMGAVCDAMDAASAWTAGAEGKDVRWVRFASSLPVVFSLGESLPVSAGPPAGATIEPRHSSAPSCETVPRGPGLRAERNFLFMCADGRFADP
ncbi:hypothetical protein [Mycobacterium montefiorense]|uniref:hypothetical protein n=1 Tax=Mycobacterium montefiorense TaxID=154654 RepID=UPI0021F33658|nr:hypothetical protein [Mycobacterium montefiorense]MCV7429527.1 DUF4267 domain-containing protein [Mycobacterium montefiorense]GLE53815.1 hypothetical protein ATCCBAA256_33770 [Mycobacterium montefiorense]